MTAQRLAQLIWELPGELISNFLEHLQDNGFTEKHANIFINESKGIWCEPHCAWQYQCEDKEH